MSITCYRLREERGETERALALDQKPRDLSSHNGKYRKLEYIVKKYRPDWFDSSAYWQDVFYYSGEETGQSPVLNLSKSNGEASGSEAGGTGPEDEDEEDEGGESDQDDVSDKEQGNHLLIILHYMFLNIDSWITHRLSLYLVNY